MKKFLILFLITLSFTVMGTAKAEGTKFVMLFEKNQTSITVDAEGKATAATPLSFEKLGDTVTYEAKVCDTEKIIIDANAQTGEIKKADCTDATATWTSTNENVATVANGVITAKGYGTTVISATVEGYDPSTLNLTLTETTIPTTTTNTDTTEATTTTEKVTYTEDVATTVNPSTGINDYMIYIIPVFLIIGSAIVLKRKEVF